MSNPNRVLRIWPGIKKGWADLKGTGRDTHRERAP